MAKYVIEDTILTNTANAIREKTGKTDKITLSNFDTEIRGIQSGGGDTTMEDGLIDGTLTEYSNDRVTKIKPHLFHSNNKLEKVNFPLVTSIGASAFNGCYKLTNANFPNLKTLYGEAFYDCEKLVRLELPKIEEIPGNCFYDSGITTLILSNQVVCTLQYTKMSSNPIAKGNGYIYVPDNLVDDYKSATNWSTHADQIKPISELEAS